MSNGHDKITNGVSNSTGSYSVPQEAQKVFENGILNNPLIAPTLPDGIADAAAKVRFEGSDKPSIPINWRFAESIAALKGLEAAMINVLLQRKYGVEAQEAVINTDHAQLFFMSILLNTIDPDNEAISFSLPNTSAYAKYFKNTDLHNQTSSPYRAAAINIYRCADDRFFHIHGSMDPQPTQDCLGLPHEMDAPTPEDSWAPYAEKVGKVKSGEMQRLASDVFKQAGTVCWTKEEFAQSEHGKANAHVGLYEVHRAENAKQSPCW
ncbi:hypothetical protein M3J09_012083 [Ascochyta lentis]